MHGVWLHWGGFFCQGYDVGVVEWCFCFGVKGLIILRWGFPDG